MGTINVSTTPGYPWFFAWITSFTTPYTWLKFDLGASGVISGTVLWKPDLQGLNPEEFVTLRVRICPCVILQFLKEMMVQVRYPSKDGTMVPMFIVHHKSTPLDGTSPALQYGLCTNTRGTLRFTCCCLGYGGFGVNSATEFDPYLLTAIKIYRTVYAVPNIRLVNLLSS